MAQDSGRVRTDLSLTPFFNCSNIYCVQIRYWRDCRLLKIAGLRESRVLCGRDCVRLLIMDTHSVCVCVVEFLCLCAA